MKLRATLLSVLALVVVAAAGGCDFKVNSTGSTIANQPPGYLKTAVPALSMALGEEKLLDPFVQTADGQPLREKLVWATSDPSVVSVEAGGGRAVARKLGVAQLTASLPSAPGQTVTISVNVVQNTVVKTIQVEPASLSLEIGQQRGLTAAVRLADGQVNGNVQWASSDATIAVVDGSGNVSALKLGRVTIIATYALDAQFKGLAELTVVPQGALATPTPSPTPTPEPTPTPTPKPSKTPRPSASPTEAPGATPTPEATATPTPEPSATPTPEATATPTPEPTATPAT